MQLEPLLFRVPRGLMSRIRVAFYRGLGMKIGVRNRIEGGGRCRRLSQVRIGDWNAFTQGCWLWPQDTPSDKLRISIGNGNFFNRNLMIDACGLVEIGDHNMVGPDVYITDSNHSFGAGVSVREGPMDVGRVKIGNGCWIGAKAVILANVELGDACVVAAGAVVTKSVPAGAMVGGVPARLMVRSEPGQGFHR